MGKSKCAKSPISYLITAPSEFETFKLLLKAVALAYLRLHRARKEYISVQSKTPLRLNRLMDIHLRSHLWHWNLQIGRRIIWHRNLQKFALTYVLKLNPKAVFFLRFFPDAKRIYIPYAFIQKLPNLTLPYQGTGSVHLHRHFSINKLTQLEFLICGYTVREKNI